MFNILTGFTYRGLEPHKPFGLELRAERFTPMPGVHQRLEQTAYSGGLGTTLNRRGFVYMTKLLASQERAQSLGRKSRTALATV